MRRLVVGDIHGGLKALEQVLNRAHVSSKDELIFVGDYVDGWSENAETIRFLMDFSNSVSCIFLKGNHDELVLEYLRDGDDKELWLTHGGQASKESYDKLPQDEIKEHIDFYKALKYFHVDEKNRLFVHAGFTNLHGPQHEHYPNMVYWDRTLWEMAYSLHPEITPDHPGYPTRLSLFREIYIGHTPVTRIGETTPQQRANVWNVDTGAAFKGPLSIIDADTKEFWQSDPVWTLYPDEKGRN